MLVVHARDGLDEISIAEETDVAELKDGAIRQFTVSPEEFEFKRSSLDSLKAADADESLKIVRSVLEDKPGPARDIVCLNAGAAIYAAGVAETLKDGVEKADAAISSGEAHKKLDQLVVLTQI